VGFSGHRRTQRRRRGRTGSACWEGRREGRVCERGDSVGCAGVRLPHIGPAQRFSSPAQLSKVAFRPDFEERNPKSTFISFSYLIHIKENNQS
jgi:hypothetical protein